MSPQLLRPDLRQARVVGHQALVAGRVFARYYRRLLEARILQQPRLDLPQLDAEPANLDLKITAPEILYVAVCQIPRQVPGPVHARARLPIGIGHKALGRQRRPPPIAPRQPRPANIELPRDPDRYRPTISIQDVNLRVGDRPPDGDCSRCELICASPVRYINC